MPYTRSRVAPVIAVLMLAGARLYDETGATGRLSVVKHYDPADRASGRYQYVPFEVLPGTRRLQISYQYDRANGENTIDLGVFEPGSLALGTRAFRGYSGGARAAVTITGDEATPGYRPGPLPPGRWHVLLGLYRVRETGVDVTITIETAADRTAPVAPAHRTAPVAPVAPSAPAAPVWFTGALHTHTVHSDGTLTPPALMRMFGDAGFDFVVITDHNNTTHRAEMQVFSAAHPRPLWIAGEEVTTPNGHAGVWGLDEGEWVDFRVRADARGIADIAGAARRYGALFAINHPASTCVGCGWEHAIVDEVAAMEISNGRHGEVDAALERWDALLQAGRRITGVGSSDWHAPPNPIDVANVRVLAPALTERALLDAIRAGRVIVMNSGRLATPSVLVRAGTQTATIGGSLRLSGGAAITVEIAAAGLAGGRVIPVVNGTRATPVDIGSQGRAQFELPVAAGYVRFELRGADNTLAALTNPVFLERP